MTIPSPGRLEYLRGELEGECISTEELVELESYAEYLIQIGDQQLMEAAGVPEIPTEHRVPVYVTISAHTPEQARREVSVRLANALQNEKLSYEVGDAERIED